MKTSLLVVLTAIASFVLGIAADRYLFLSVFEIHPLSSTAIKMNRRTGQTWIFDGGVWNLIETKRDIFDQIAPDKPKN
jgi:hypothetical protein